MLGLNEADILGEIEGERDGEREADGETDGDIDGLIERERDGDKLGESEGESEGENETPGCLNAPTIVTLLEVSCASAEKSPVWPAESFTASAINNPVSAPVLVPRS